MKLFYTEITMELPAAFACGLAAGFTNALSTGGGLLTLPSLLLLGLSPISAVATSRLGTLSSGITSTYRYNLARLIQWRYMPWFVLMALGAGIVGPQLIPQTDEALLKHIIGVTIGPGSGLLYVYILVSCFGMRVIEANTTCIFFGLLGTATALATYITHGVIDFRFGLPLRPARQSVVMREPAPPSSAALCGLNGC